MNSNLSHLSNRRAFEKALMPHEAPLNEQVRITGHPKQLFYSLLAREMGHLELTEIYLVEALQLRSNEPFFHLMLADFYLESERLEEALCQSEKLLQLAPSCIEAHEKIAYARQKQEQFPLAIESYKRALDLDPNRCANLYNLGLCLDTMGKTQEALESYQKALNIQPGFVPALNNRGNILARLHCFDEAITCFQVSLQYEPDLPDAYINFANVLRSQDKLDHAMALYQKALTLDDNSSIAHYNIANCYKQLDEMDLARSHYQRAAFLDPSLHLARWGSCICSLPRMHESESAIESCRSRYSQELSYLESLPLNASNLSSAVEAVGEFYPFFLAYQMGVDRDLQKRYGTLTARIMALRYPQWSVIRKPIEKPQGSRLRVGFVSKFFQLHSVWKIPLGGWIQGLNREKFDVYSYITGGKRNEVTYMAQQLSSRCIVSSSLELLAQGIIDDQLDVLIFPEIGMDPLALRLAALRLAPIQCTGLGHPQTTGLPTLDYFLSSEWMETEASQSHYTESLVRLPNFGCYYLPNQTPHDPQDWQALGIREDSIKYLCCQSLFKYLPQYDWVFAAIAQRVPKAQFIFTASDVGLKSSFFNRLEKEFQRRNLSMQEHVVVLDRLPVAQFVALCRHCDLFLDSIGWSGFNSTIEALEQHLPVLTMPGQLARSRHSYAVLRHLGLEEMIASTIQEYVELACRWATDLALQNRIQTQVSERVHKLYRDTDFLAAMEQFLLSLLH